MKAAGLLTPLVVLGLLLVMPRLEVWAQRPTVSAIRPRRRVRPMTSPAPADTDAAKAPILRDPPPPPGYVEPLAGSSAEDTFTQQTSSAQHDEPSITMSTPGSGV